MAGRRQAEVVRHDFDVVSAGGDGRRLTVHEPKTRVDLSKDVLAHGFGFDAIFTEADGNVHRAAPALA